MDQAFGTLTPPSARRSGPAPDPGPASRRCRHLQQQVIAARGGEDLLDLANAFSRVMIAACARGSMVSKTLARSRPLPRRLPSFKRVAAMDARGLQPLQPGLHGGPRDFIRRARVASGHACIGAEQPDDVAIHFIHAICPVFSSICHTYTKIL